MASKLQEITGRFIQIRHNFPASDPSQPPTIIGDIHYSHDETGGHNGQSKPNGKVTIKGPANPSELSKDLEYRFYGAWTHYFNKHQRKNERQFRFNSFVRLAPATREAIIGYLCSHGTGLGLGKQRAGMLYQLFGGEAVTVARTEPERVAKELTKNGLLYRVEQAELLASSLAEDHAIEAIKLDLTGLVTGRGFPKSIVNTIIQEWGNKAAMIVRRDPYRLLKFSGCGFKRCDAMYLDLGHDPARLKRQALCAWYSLASNTDGHTWFTWKVIDGYLRANIAGAGVRVEKAIELAVRAKKVMEVRTSPEGSIVSQGSEHGLIRWFAEYEKAVNELEIMERVVG